jgi:transcriptional regulator with XRE-family HTH domain
MPSRDHTIGRAHAAIDRMTTNARVEIREARLAAGLSQRDVGRAVGLSQSQVARFERGRNHATPLELLCRLAIGVGLDPSLRFYPGGDAVRDVAQIRLLDRLRTRLGADVRVRTEVPLFGVHDARAWDAILDGTGCVDAVEAETRIRDLQATTRRIGLKSRDDPTITHVILLVSDTRWNRQVLAAGREALRSDYPLDTRAALDQLRLGRCPGTNAIVIL